MIINLEDDDGGAHGVLGIGWHTVRIKSQKEVKSNNGNPGIEYTFEGPDGTIRKAWWITPDAKYRFKNFAQCCGYTGSLRTLDTNSLVGATVQIEVQKGEPNKNGKIFKEVVNYMPVNAGTPVDDDGEMF